MRRVLEPQHEHRQPLECERPDDAKRVRLAQRVRVAAGPDHRDELQDDNQVDHPVGRSVLPVRRPEPVGHHAVFRDAIQDSIRADNRRVDRARQHQEADDDYESLEQQSQ